jgi:hypothetical protein
MKPTPAIVARRSHLPDRRVQSAVAQGRIGPGRASNPKRMRTESGGYRRDHLRALAQGVEVDQKELRNMGSKSVLLRTLAATSSARTAGFGVPSSVPNWRTRHDSNV